MSRDDALESQLSESEFVDWDSPTVTLTSHETGFVYIFLICFNNRMLPLYVGETDSIQRRIGEYEYKDYFAPTDFKVGAAISWFRALGYSIRLGFRRSSSRGTEEKEIITELIVAGFHLINSLPGYVYQKGDNQAHRDAQRRIVERFCEMFLGEGMKS